MFVLETLRDPFRLFHFDLFGRGIQLIVGLPTFCGAAHVSRGMSQRNSRFGHADKFHRLLRRYRKLQRFRIGEANVFACENDDAACNEPEIFAGMQHFREPVHRAFLIGSTHAFNKRTDRVVVRIAGTIINDRFLLNAFFGDMKREMNPPFAVAGGGDPGNPRMFFTLGGPTSARSAAGGVRTPISSAFKHLRASPSLSFARC